MTCLKGKALMQLSCMLPSSHQGMSHSFHKITLSSGPHCDPTRGVLRLGWLEGKQEQWYACVCLCSCHVSVADWMHEHQAKLRFSSHGVWCTNVHDVHKLLRLSIHAFWCPLKGHTGSDASPTHPSNSICSKCKWGCLSFRQSSD